MDGTRCLGRSGEGAQEGLSPTMRRYCAQWPLEGVCRADRARRGASQPDPATREAAFRQIAPEYRRRVVQDGKPSADAWLQRRARAMGERAGREKARPALTASGKERLPPRRATGPETCGSRGRGLRRSWRMAPVQPRHRGWPRASPVPPRRNPQPGQRNA